MCDFICWIRFLLLSAGFWHLPWDQHLVVFLQHHLHVQQSGKKVCGIASKPMCFLVSSVRAVDSPTSTCNYRRLLFYYSVHWYSYDVHLHRLSVTISCSAAPHATVFLFVLLPSSATRPATVLCSAQSSPTVLTSAACPATSTDIGQSSC